MRNGGQVVLMRYADAPGAGDPASFDIENCATQRNLSDRGRQQARRIGALVFARSAPIDQVLVSQFCRTSDTGRLAFGDDLVEIFPALDYIAGDEEGQAERYEELRQRALGYSGSGNLIMVTHAEVIEEITGRRTRPGQMVILSRSGEELGFAGSITFN